MFTIRDLGVDYSVIFRDGRSADVESDCFRLEDGTCVMYKDYNDDLFINHSKRSELDVMVVFDNVKNVKLNRNFKNKRFSPKHRMVELLKFVIDKLDNTQAKYFSIKLENKNKIVYITHERPYFDTILNNVVANYDEELVNIVGARVLGFGYCGCDTNAIKCIDLLDDELKGD